MISPVKLIDEDQELLVEALDVLSLLAVKTERRNVIASLKRLVEQSAVYLGPLEDNEIDEAACDRKPGDAG